MGQVNLNHSLRTRYIPLEALLERVLKGSISKESFINYIYANTDKIAQKKEIEVVQGKIDIIIDCFCDAFKVNRDILMSKTRLRVVSECRHAIAHYCLCKSMKCTYIGKNLNRHHSTILHSKSVVAETLLRDKNFYKMYHIAVVKYASDGADKTFKDKLNDI